jgi:hypothetical protein
MARTFKLCILRVRHDTRVATISDDACRRYLIEAAERSAIVQYWRDVTFGFIDLEVDMLPWYDVTVTDTGRGAVFILGFNAARSAGRDLSGYHGFLTIALPGFVEVPNPLAGQPGQPATIRNGFDGGAGAFVQPDGRGFCTLPLGSSDHTFMAHELGHVLGYEHTWGLTNNGVDWDPAPPFDASQEYGDPYDIMSSASFGSRWDPALPQWFANPTFARNDLGTVNPTWPNQSAWNVMGPHLALANLRFRDPDALGARARVLVRPQAGWSGDYNLLSVGLPAERGGTRLLILRPPGSSTTGPDPNGTLYVEYRGLDGWDRGLETAGDDLARRAVIVHERASNGAGVSVLWYRGRVVIPTEVDRDIRPANSDLVVTVASVTGDRSAVTVTLSTNTERRVVLTRDIDVAQETIVARESHEVVSLCGTNSFELRALDLIYAVTFRASAFGYGGAGIPDVSRPPRLTWSIGGVPLAAPAGTVGIPTVAGDRSVTLDYTIDATAGTLEIRNRPVDDAYTVRVTALVSEADGAEPRSTSQDLTLDGQITRFEDAYYRAMLDCERRITARIGLKRRWWIPDPDPIRDRIIPPRPTDRLRQLAKLLGDQRPDLAADLNEMIKARGGAEALEADLHRRVAKLRRDPQGKIHKPQGLATKVSPGRPASFDAVIVESPIAAKISPTIVEASLTPRLPGGRLKKP